MEVEGNLPAGPVPVASPKWQRTDSARGRRGRPPGPGIGPGHRARLYPRGQAVDHARPGHAAPLDLRDDREGADAVQRDRAAAPAPRPIFRDPYPDAGTVQSLVRLLPRRGDLGFPDSQGQRTHRRHRRKALYYRAPFSSQAGVKPYLPAPAEHPALPADQCIAWVKIIDLTSRSVPMAGWSGTSRPATGRSCVSAAL